MKYYKTTLNGYILSISTNGGAEEITEAEYSAILDIIHNKPIAESGYDYRLKDTLEWELVELPPVPEDDEATIEDYEAALAEVGV